MGRFFIPIVQRQLKYKFDYKVAYVDTMAGSGITRTKRAGDFFCGSCTGAVLAAIDKNYPFDKIIAVEKNQNKAKALKARLKKINPQLSVDVYDKSLSKVKSIIASELKQDCISCIVIDSEGFQGLTWESINPLLNINVT